MGFDRWFQIEYRQIHLLVSSTHRTSKDSRSSSSKGQSPSEGQQRTVIRISNTPGVDWRVNQFVSEVVLDIAWICSPLPGSRRRRLEASDWTYPSARSLIRVKVAYLEIETSLDAELVFSIELQSNLRPSTTSPREP